VTDTEKKYVDRIMTGVDGRETPDETGLCYAIVRSDSGRENTYVNLKEVEMTGR